VNDSVRQGNQKFDERGNLQKLKTISIFWEGGRGDRRSYIVVKDIGIKIKGGDIIYRANTIKKCENFAVAWMRSHPRG